MKTALRVALILLLAAQAWWAWTVTRYEGHFRAGVRAWDTADVENVSGHFEAAISTLDGDAYTWAWLGDSYLYSFDWTGARDIDPARGSDLLERAWDAYAGSVRRCPSYAWSWGGLAGVANRRVQLGNRVAGIDITRLARLRERSWEPTRVMALSAGMLAVDLRPSGFQELDILAEVHQAAGERDLARELLGKSARTMPAPSYHAWGTGRRLQQDLYLALLPPLDEGIAEAPDFDRSMLSLEVGLFASAQNDPVRAVDYFDRANAQARNPYQRYRALWERSGVLPELGRYEDAIADLEAVLKLPYDRRPAYRRLAVLQEDLGHHDRACVAFLRTTSAEVTPAWRIRAAGACAQAGETALALGVLDAGIRSPRDDRELAKALIEMYIRFDRPNTARGRLDEWIAHYPESDVFPAWRNEFFPEDENRGAGS